MSGNLYATVCGISVIILSSLSFIVIAINKCLDFKIYLCNRNTFNNPEYLESLLYS